MPTTTVHPDVPTDPLAPSTGAQWAVARRDAVLALGLEHRTTQLLDALKELDSLLDDLGYEVLTDELIDESEIEILDDADTAAEAFVKAKGRGREQMARAETIVLSGHDVKRKIRYKQSVMPLVMADNLFADVKALFEIGDREGALVSLERMVVVAPLSPSVRNFLSHNETRLLDYYQNVFGPFTRMVNLKEEKDAMPPTYFKLEKVRQVVDVIDGKRTVQDVINHCDLETIEACAVLSQLYRSDSIDIPSLD